MPDEQIGHDGLPESIAVDKSQPLRVLCVLRGESCGVPLVSAQPGRLEKTHSRGRLCYTGRGKELIM